jgi:hypothetical protein
MCYKVKYPENFFLLRGNHECASITRIYGFYDECKRRYNIKMWKAFCDAFNCLPVCAVVDEKILCMHGGLSPEISNFDQVRKIVRPTDVPDSAEICRIHFLYCIGKVLKTGSGNPKRRLCTPGHASGTHSISGSFNVCGTRDEPT